MRDDLYLAVGDTKPMDVWIVDELGAAVDLTGATVTILGSSADQFWGQVWPSSVIAADTPFISGTCTPDTDQTTNTGKCSWTPSGLTKAGTFAAQAKVVWSSGTRHYPPNPGQRIIEVGASLA